MSRRTQELQDGVRSQVDGAPKAVSQPLNPQSQAEAAQSPTTEELKEMDARRLRHREQAQAEHRLGNNVKTRSQEGIVDTLIQGNGSLNLRSPALAGSCVAQRKPPGLLVDDHESQEDAKNRPRGGPHGMATEDLYRTGHHPTLGTMRHRIELDASQGVISGLKIELQLWKDRSKRIETECANRLKSTEQHWLSKSKTMKQSLDITTHAFKRGIARVAERDQQLRAEQAVKEKLEARLRAERLDNERLKAKLRIVEEGLLDPQTRELIETARNQKHARSKIDPEPVTPGPMGTKVENRTNQVLQERVLDQNGKSREQTRGTVGEGPSTVSPLERFNSHWDEYSIGPHNQSKLSDPIRKYLPRNPTLADIFQLADEQTNCFGRVHRDVCPKPRILAHLGTGTYGEVSKCQRNPKANVCAVKRLVVQTERVASRAPDLDHQLDCAIGGFCLWYNEVRCLIALSKTFQGHGLSNIVGFEGYAEFSTPDQSVDRHLYLEYCEGDLFAILCKEGKLDDHKAMKLLLDVMTGLSALHDLHLIHNDLKPTNILYKTTGPSSTDWRGTTWKIADFGLVQRMRPDGKYGSASRTNAYASPERWVDDEEHDEKADIWAAYVLWIEARGLYVRLDGKDFDGRTNCKAISAIGGNNGYKTALWGRDFSDMGHIGKADRPSARDVLARVQDLYDLWG